MIWCLYRDEIDNYTEIKLVDSPTTFETWVTFLQCEINYCQRNNYWHLGDKWGESSCEKRSGFELILVTTPTFRGFLLGILRNIVNTYKCSNQIPAWVIIRIIVAVRISYRLIVHLIMVSEPNVRPFTGLFELHNTTKIGKLKMICHCPEDCEYNKRKMFWK